MLYPLSLSSKKDSSVQKVLLSIENVRNEKAIYFITLTASEKKNNFKTLYNGKLSENCEAMILKKVWGELSVKFPDCMFGKCLIASDEIKGAIILDKNSCSDINKLINKIICELKSRSEKLLNYYKGTFGRVFWENGFKHILLNPKSAMVYLALGDTD
jgi:hypothetical protein